MSTESLSKSAPLQSLIHRRDKVLAVLHPPTAAHARIMEKAGCEALFVGTGGVVGAYTGLAEVGTAIRVLPMGTRFDLPMFRDESGVWRRRLRYPMPAALRLRRPTRRPYAVESLCRDGNSVLQTMFYFEERGGL